MHLWVQHNQLRDLPLEGGHDDGDAGLIQLAPNLTSLDVSHNELTSFGSPSDYPVGLTYLDMANNFITSVGDPE